MHDDDGARPPGGGGRRLGGHPPLPFLAVYATLFILHGWPQPVHPPDITSSQTGELIAGLVALVLFVAMALTLWWFLNRVRRWPRGHAVAPRRIGVPADRRDVGGRAVLFLMVASTRCRSCWASPRTPGARRRRAPDRVRRLYGWRPGGPEAAAGDPHALAGSGDTTVVEPASLRRRRPSAD